jgi:hypothetical protein
LDALSRYDGLQSIRLNTLGAYVLGLTDTHQPTNSDATDAPRLTMLPNLDIVATGDIPAADRLVLSAYAKQTTDRVWTVSATSLLSAIDAGRELAEFTTFLTQRTEHELPSTLSTLIADVHRRAGQLTDLGHARVLECADPATAALIAHDRSLRPLCHPIGDKHLAVPARSRAEVPQSPAQTRLRKPGTTRALSDVFAPAAGHLTHRQLCERRLHPNPTAVPRLKWRPQLMPVRRNRSLRLQPQPQDLSDFDHQYLPVAHLANTAAERPEAPKPRRVVPYLAKQLARWSHQ